MEIQKIKIKKKAGKETYKTFVAFTKDGPLGGEENCVLHTNEQPMPAFFKAFQDLASEVNAICEFGLTGGQVTEMIEISSVKLTDKGVTVCAIKSLKKTSQPLIINTPFKFFDKLNENTPNNMVMSDTMKQKMNHLIKKCREFINGDRVQPALIEEDGEQETKIRKVK